MFEGEKVRLRAVEEEDLSMIAGWRNSPGVRRYMFTQDLIAESRQKRWFAAVANDDTKRYYVVETDDGPVGMVYIDDIDWRNRRAEWGIYIGEKGARRKGYASEAARLMLRYAFGYLNLNRIFARMLADNARGIEFHERLGFRRDGVLKDYIVRDGEYVDVVVMSLSGDEFLERYGG